MGSVVMRPETISCKDKLIGDLRARREALGWSVKEVEDRTGLDETVIAQWERGDVSPRLDAAANWASALGLTLSVMAAEDKARRGLHVDWQARRISVDGTLVRLTPMEWKALERLAASPGELVPHIDPVPASLWRERATSPPIDSDPRTDYQVAPAAAAAAHPGAMGPRLCH